MKIPLGVISVVGLGKLGAPLSALLAVKGYRVIGVDDNPVVVDSINNGRAPVEEPELQEYLDRRNGMLTATLDCDEAVQRSGISIVVVPTPSTENGCFSNRHVCDVIEGIGRSLRGKSDYHVVNVMSTVMPGSCDGEIAQSLQLASGREIGRDVGLCYNPEFIALGSVLRDMRLPDFVLLGESDSRAGDEIERIYRQVCENAPPVRRMALINAEISKIAINTFLTTKISYANMLAEICERLPGADAEVVTAAMGSDSRIGVKYLRGALGYGGPCFPRDNVAFMRMAEELGAYAALAKATDETNRHQVERLLRIVIPRVRSGGTIGILGMSYKPYTAVIEGSQSVELAAALMQRGYSVVIYDPLASSGAGAALGPDVKISASIEDCAGASEFLIIATMWPQFRNIAVDFLRRSGRKLPVLDCWRLLPPETYGEVIDLIQLGRGGSLLSATSEPEETSDKIGESR